MNIVYSVNGKLKLMDRGCGQNPGDKFTSGDCPSIQAKPRKN